MKQWISVLFILVLPFATFSQEQSGPPMSEETKKMMEVWMKYASPAEQHKKLMDLAGSYSIQVKSRFEPEGQFMENTGECTKEAVLGGRYLHEQCKSPEMAGMPPFEGMGMIGYNNYTQQHELYWFDNMSTMGFVMKGTADPSGKVVTLKGSYEDPMTKKNKNMRWVLTIMDASKHKLELYDTDSAGKEFMGAEISYTRK